MPTPDSVAAIERIGKPPGGVHSTALRVRGAFLLLSFPVLLGAVLAGFAVLSARFHIPGQESMLHSKIGSDILATHTWPTTETYSFTASGADCIAFEWLSDLLMAEVEHSGGLPGLMALLLVLAAAVTLLLYYFTWQRCRNAKAAFVACLFVLPLMPAFLYLRAQLLGIAFLVVTLICLERFRQGHSRALWILPPLFLIWVNTHATFLFGLAILGLYWASGLTGFRAGGLRAERWTPAQRLQLLRVALLSVIAITVTPYGTRLAAAPLDAFLHAPLGMSLINEYQPLGVGGSSISLKVFLVLVAFFVLALVVLRPVYRLEEMAFLLFAAYAGCVHGRFLILFVLAFAPMLAALLAGWIPKYEANKDHYLLNAALMLLAIWGMAKLALSPHQIQTMLAGEYPEGGVDYLRAHPVPGPMFNTDSWGDYLIWKFNGNHKVFVDTRTVPYEEEGVFADFAGIFEVQADTRFLLRKYGIKSFLLPRGAPLIIFLSALPGWQRVYDDGVSVIFVRKQ